MALQGPESIEEPYPAPDRAVMSTMQRGFKISTRKLPISRAEPIERMTKALGIAPPEMIFGENMIMIEHAPSHFCLCFNTFDALDAVDKTGQSMLQVAHSKEWQSSREKTHEGITEVVRPFDWSYSTNYKGSLGSESPGFQASEQEIPVELLKRPDPICFFDEVMLYEDEMADNGITMLSCKVRVMPERMLLLCRFFMRLDNVLIRIRDTRVYIDFVTGHVIREYQAKESPYDTTREALARAGHDPPAKMRDANAMAEILSVVDRTLESMTLFHINGD